MFLCVCTICVSVCLYVLLPPRWQVRESNVMRLSPLWFKHEYGKMATERENQFSFSGGTGTQRD